MNLWLIVPAKPFEEGKSRLADTLLPSERAAVNQNLLTHVLKTASAADVFANTIVISQGKQVLEYANTLGAIALHEDLSSPSLDTPSLDAPLLSASSPSSAPTKPQHNDSVRQLSCCATTVFTHAQQAQGTTVRPSAPTKKESSEKPAYRKEEKLNRALSQARGEAVARGADAILVLPVDLPLLSVDDIHALYRIGRRQPGVVIARSNDGGTNALLLRPPHAIDFWFGVQSFQRHFAAVIAAGYPCEVIESPSLAFDLDGPKDWLRWQKQQQFTMAGYG